MTMSEFEQWIEQKYGDLLAVARRRVRKEDASDVLQSAVLRMWNSPDLDLRVALHATPERPLAVWPWAVGIVRSEASTKRRSARRNGTKHLPAHFRGEEETARDTRKEERSQVKKLTPEADALRFADRYALERLEENREDFDMEGYGRSKTDPNFEVQL